MPQEQFYPCLTEWFDTDIGRNEKNDIVLHNGKIKGWRQFVTPNKIDDVYEDGPQYLKDIDYLCNKYGFPDTYSYSSDMLTY